MSWANRLSAIALGLVELGEKGVRDIFVLSEGVKSVSDPFFLDGLQLSDSWSTGAVTGDDRILKSVGDPAVAQDIRNSLSSGRVERWVVHTDPYGNVSVGLLDKNGKFIPDPQGASKILGGKQ